VTNEAPSPAASGYQLLTGPGPAAIAIIRVFGPQARDLERFIRPVRTPPTPAVTRARALGARRSGEVFRAQLLDQRGETIDDILVSVHADAPTLDVRLHLHGSPTAVRLAEELIESCGIVAAAPGASGVWPGVDPLESAALSLLPRMRTMRGARWLAAQPERLREAVAFLLQPATTVEVARNTCRVIAERSRFFDWFAKPLRVVLAGPPNAGKSTLFNALAGQTVSIVSPQPGTTRDWIEAPDELDGFPVTWIDSAGLYDVEDVLESAAMDRARGLIAGSDAVLVVLDARLSAAADREGFLAAYGDLRPAVVAVNKVDAPGADFSRVCSELPGAWRPGAVPTSATAGTGLPDLRRRILDVCRPGLGALDEPAAFTGALRGALIFAATSSSKSLLCNRLRATLLAGD
jgi:tRNA modification GTPase